MQRAIINWYKKNRRDLPWRKTTPWGVLLSEYMLQQTPVSRVLPIWSEWIKRWPTPRHLSKARRSDVIKAWGSLGYPTRALRLHQAATIIATEYKNKVPNTLEDLRKLPGIGEYTAAGLRFLNPTVFTSKPDFPDYLLADRGLSNDDTIAPGESKEIVVKIQDARWDIERLSDLAYDTDSQIGGLLFFFSPGGTRYASEIGGPVIPKFVAGDMP